MPNFINVILPLPLEKHFTYSVSPEEADFLQPGMRVAVPFGKSKVYTGIVASLHQEDPKIYEAKPIEQILDEVPLVTAHQLKFWRWISEYYMCTEGDVLRAALPGAFLLEGETVVQLYAHDLEEPEGLTDDEFMVFEALQRQSVLKINEIIQILDKKKVWPVIQSLVNKKVVTVNQEVSEQYKPKMERYVRLDQEYDSETAMQELLDELHRAPKQRAVILSLLSLQARDKKPMKASWLAKKSGSSSSIIRSLIDKEILQEYHLQTDRVQYEGNELQVSPTLSEHQEMALEEIKGAFKVQPVCLLHGVTSSGKTEVYVKLIETMISHGKQVLYLLPEIALTTQLISRLRGYFGDKVAVFHSKYTLNERVEVYQKVLQDSMTAKVIVGVRSSIFLPFKSLGLVVIDEEHESTFKQYDPAPRYHARDSAIILAGMHGAKVLLGSATPSMESYRNALQGKFALVSLTRRHGNVLLPEIEIVDLKDKQRKRKMQGHFSDRLIEEIRETLTEQKQVILFQNRRGYSPILECKTCGHSPQCPNCDVSLTFHSHNNKLRCHYCGYNIPLQRKCMACGSPDLDTKGFGTEKVEAELKDLFPGHKVARMDVDTTRGKYAYEKIISAFESGEVEILIGTQMLTKGLDFRNVSLVGIMNADSLLNFPDFRAHERSFQLMLQVAGRAGRTQQRGKVLIQTYNPHHRIVQQVSTHDYLEMFQEQKEERRQYKYPPYYRLIKISLKSRDFSKVNDGADWLGTSFRNSFGENVLGPVFPPVSRIRNEYYKNIMIKIPHRQSLGKTKSLVERILQSFRAIGSFRSIKLIVNVDPY